MDYYEDEAPKKGFTVWKLIKWLLLLLTIAIYLLLTLRSCALEGLKDTAKTRKLLWNETSLSAYNASPDTFSVYKNSADSIVTNDGTITVTNIHWLQSAGQLQLTVRYNDSLARTIEDEFSLDAEPTGEYLTFALRDDLGNVYTAFEYVTDEAFIYNFRRLVFDGVKLDGSSTLSLEVYYTGYVDYNNTSAPLNSITIYSASDGLEPYELKNSELPNDGISANLNSSKVWTTAPDDSDTESN
jgi:hypothetical protein